MYLIDVHPSEIFQALSDAVRLRIVRVLTYPDIVECCSCDLADGLSEPEYAVSRQLKVLRSAGILSAEKQGRWIYHRLRSDHAVLRRLTSLVRELPDTDEFKQDHNKLLKLVRSRAGSRCKGRSNAMSRQNNNRESLA